MASSIFFLGVSTSRPGAVTKVDASGLATTGLGANGIVALIGEGEGGRPVSDILTTDDIIRYTRPETGRETFSSGDLREASDMAFEPSSDTLILGGAQEVVAMKVNPATQSTAALSNSAGDIIDLTSADWGARQDQINVAVGNGTAAGTKLYTVVFEDESQAGDNLGGDAVFSVAYTQGAGNTTYDEVKLNVTDAGVVAAVATRAETGADDEDTVPFSGPDVITVDGQHASNVGKIITLYGTDNATGNPVKEQIVVQNGDVDSSTTFSAFYGATLSEAAVGDDVEVREGASVVLDFTVAGGAVELGARVCNAMFVDGGKIALSASSTYAGIVQIWGKNAAGQEVGENITLPGVAGQPVLSSGSYTEITIIGLLAAPVAQTFTLRANAVKSNPAIHTTITKLKDLFDAKTATVSSVDVGFGMTILTTKTTLETTKLDEMVDIVCDSTDGATTADVTANVDSAISWFNTSSERVNAVESTLTKQVSRINIDDSSTPSQKYVITIDSIPVHFTADASPTDAEVQAGLIAAINATPQVNAKVLAAAQSGSSTGIDIFALLGTPTSVVEAEADLSLTTPTLTSGVRSAPSNTTTPVFLTGGGEGTTTFSNWQSALDWLKQIRVNTIVVLTGDPAVHAAVSAHCKYMGGLGKSERDGLVGLSALDVNSAPTGELPTKASIKSQIIDLNTRHIRACAQTVDRYNTSGVRETFKPWFQAAVVAGMQAGTSVGEPLTHKYANVLLSAEDSSWNPTEDADEMINSGLCFMENQPGVGRRIVRNITTHLVDDNLAFIEGSVNSAVNFATYNFRTTLEFAVGRKGNAATLNTVRGRALNTLDQLMDEGALVNHRALDLQLVRDVLDVSVEMAPVIPINFVPTTVHLVTFPQTA